jgi:N-ethylmaleimide reductase
VSNRPVKRSGSLARTHYIARLCSRRSEQLRRRRGRATVAAQCLRQIFKGTIVAAGGFEPESAADIVAKGDADLVAFGRHFVSPPDWPCRIAEGLPLSPYDRDAFYTFDAKGYTDYPAIDATAA